MTSSLSANKNPRAIDLLRANPERINWFELSANPNPEAIELLLENQDKIEWRMLSQNTNPAAIELLRENPEQMYDWWHFLSANPAAMDLLLENQDKIDWTYLSLNPAIFDDLGKAAGKIQRGFRKSQGYAAWKYSPERLASQGYFENMDFGKRIKRKSNTTYSKMSLKTIDRLIKLVQKI